MFESISVLVNSNKLKMPSETLELNVVQLSKLTNKELHKLCIEYGIIKYSKLVKAKLIEKIIESH